MQITFYFMLCFSEAGLYVALALLELTVDQTDPDHGDPPAPASAP